VEKWDEDFEVEVDYYVYYFDVVGYVNDECKGH
jgi:hypothetical protein